MKAKEARVGRLTDEPLPIMADIHVMPNDGKHSCEKTCFCEPRLSYQDETTLKKVWVHKSDEELCQ